MMCKYENGYCGNGNLWLRVYISTLSANDTGGKGFMSLTRSSFKLLDFFLKRPSIALFNLLGKGLLQL